MRGDYDVPHSAEDYEKVNQSISYEPEVSWNYELGTHLNLFENALHLDADLGKVLISFWARNLTNTHYNTFAIDNAATGSKEYFAQRGNPFQCGVDLRFHF